MHFLASDAAVLECLLWFGASCLSLPHISANLNLGDDDNVTFCVWSDEPVFPQILQIVTIEIEEEK